MSEGSSVQSIFGEIKARIRGTTSVTAFENGLQPHQEDLSQSCPCCGTIMSSVTSHGEIVTHNPRTCQLVNLVFAEMGFTMEPQIRVEIYPGAGPLRGFYSTSDPYTIHISEDAYLQYPEYVIFHETKHLVDCHTKGWSEEGTPDSFARNLCLKYGYRPPPQHPGVTVYNGIWNAVTPWY